MSVRQLGRYVYATATIGAGIINLVWHDFATGWQPIQAFGDRVPGHEQYAIVTAVWLIAGGAGILYRRSAAAGGVALAVVYSLFGAFWLPRFHSVIHLFGFRFDMLAGVLDGVGQQVILAAAAVLVWVCYSSAHERTKLRIANAARWAFGLSCIAFGLTHFLSVSSVVPLVPAWLPPSGAFWAILTGVAFVLAGVAILTRILDILAARLLTAQLLVFSVLVCLPWIAEDPRSQLSWGGNAYNLAAAGAAWILADWLQSRAKPR